MKRIRAELRNRMSYHVLIKQLENMGLEIETGKVFMHGQKEAENIGKYRTRSMPSVSIATFIEKRWKYSAISCDVLQHD